MTIRNSDGDYYYYDTGTSTTPINLTNIGDSKINWAGSSGSAGWSPHLNFPGVRDVLILVRNYVNRADTVDDFLQLSERINFICEILEADIRLTSEQIEMIFSLSYKEFQFLNKRRKEYRAVLEEWSNKKKDVALEDRLFEVE